MPHERLMLWLGLLAAVLVWFFAAPQSKEVSKPKAPPREAAQRGVSYAPEQARELIVGRNMFQPLVSDEKGPPEAGVDLPPLDLPVFPLQPQEPPASPPSPPSPLVGIELRGVVESSEGKLALLEGPDFPAIYLAPGQSQARVKLEKLGDDWAQVSYGLERKVLKLPGEFSVEPLGTRKGGGQE